MTKAQRETRKAVGRVKFFGGTKLLKRILIVEQY